MWSAMAAAGDGDAVDGLFLGGSCPSMSASGGDSSSAPRSGGSSTAGNGENCLSWAPVMSGSCEETGGVGSSTCVGCVARGSTRGWAAGIRPSGGIPSATDSLLLRCSFSHSLKRAHSLRRSRSSRSLRDSSC